MKLATLMTTAVLSLTLVAAAPAFAQEKHEQEEPKAQPAQEEKKAQPEKSAKQAEKPSAQPEKNVKPAEKNAKQENNNAKPAEKNAKQENNNAKPAQKNAKQENNNAKPAEKNAKQENNARPAQNNGQQQQRAGNNGGGRIPEANFKAHFGEQHTFRVSQSDYNNHRFQYGGYWFGFEQPWPSNWLYTQDVYVVDIDGVYYLCNASYPGVNLALSFAL
jgi:outer membrane biosynthesis protein TonB